MLSEAEMLKFMDNPNAPTPEQQAKAAEHEAALKNLIERAKKIPLNSLLVDVERGIAAGNPGISHREWVGAVINGLRLNVRHFVVNQKWTDELKTMWLNRIELNILALESTLNCARGQDVPWTVEEILAREG